MLLLKFYLVHFNSLRVTPRSSGTCIKQDATPLVNIFVSETLTEQPFLFKTFVLFIT